MDDQSIRYTIGQMIALNHGKVNVPPGMAKLFSTYMNGIPKDYNNKHNVNILTGSLVQKKTILSSGKPSENAYQDQNILNDIRHIFGSLAKSKTDTTVGLINRITIPVTMVTEVAKLFFDTCIQCPAVCDEYLDVLFRLSFPNQLEQKISYQFVQILIANYIKPPVLPDSKLESGADRTKNVHAATCLVFIKLFTYKFPETDMFKNPRSYFGLKAHLDNFLTPLFKKMTEGDATALNNVAVVWKILMAKCPEKFDVSSYKEQIRAVYENKTLYKLTVRLLLKDFI
jgi:hypothetical protein